MQHSVERKFGTWDSYWIKHNKSIKILAEELANLVGVEGTMDIDILHDTGPGAICVKAAPG